MEILFSINRRKRTARRAFKKCPLFAVQIVSDKLSCEYNADVLTEDLKLRRKPKIKRKKIKPRFDFRFMQLKKLSESIITSENEKERQSLISRYVAMAEADSKRQDIVLTITYQGESTGYFFHWTTKEKVIKDIAGIANRVKSFDEFEREKELYLKRYNSCGN
ncbi:MAG: hypothetical protein MUE72_13755 [Chitinophagaceae bacterium]|jgi:hypothetical protein|nr:hypothetical protein [Chitinophagaceae bacterium]